MNEIIGSVSISLLAMIGGLLILIVNILYYLNKKKPSENDQTPNTKAKWLVPIFFIFGAACIIGVAVLREIGVDDPQLIQAVRHKDKLQVEALLKNGMDVNIQNSWGWSPLMEAAANNDTTIIRILLDYKANPNLRADRGRTALSIAVHSGSTEAVRMLKDAGAK